MGGRNNYNSSRKNINNSNKTNNNNKDSNLTKYNYDIRNSQFLSRHIPDHSDQSPRPIHSTNIYLHSEYGEAKVHSHGNHSGEDQFHQLHNKYKPEHSCQYLSGDHDCEGRKDARPTGGGGVEHQSPKQNITTEERK